MILKSLRIGFIGGGNMASAMISGLLQHGIAAESLMVVEHNPENREQLSKRFSLTALADADASINQCDILILAVKPQQFHHMVEQIKAFITQPLLFSIAAGIRLVDLQHWFNNYPRVVRAMPNTPALIGKGMTGLTAPTHLTQHDRDIATAIAQAIGEYMWVKDDNEIDALTAISGSGPAYVFYLLEAMQEAAQTLGLSTEQGKLLAISTFIGAASLAKNTNVSPTELRQQVSSPGGATLAALNVLNQHQVNEVFKQAMRACTMRSKEMGELFAQTATNIKP